MRQFESEISVKDMFSETLFRIPDYQRGYSWDRKQLDDLWEDIINLYEANEHYTGLITVSDANEPESEWTGYSVQYIIDGQQRLTTIVVLLQSIVERAVNLQLNELGHKPLADVIQKYLHKDNPNNNSIKASILGYSYDDPSDEYLKCDVLGIKEQPREKIKTAYTERLRRAKAHFDNKMKDYNETQLNELFSIVTEKLVFNKYHVVGEREVSMIFESMNNRGKSLSTLELLKNRLMYITEKLKLRDEERIELREKIKKSWKIVYEWLGKDVLMDDDEFLRAHWIMYYKYDRSKSKAYAEDLLNNTFSVSKVYKSGESLEYKHVSDYAVSLSDSVKHWYYINYPERADNIYNERVVNELARLKRIGNTAFKPLIMALLLETEGKEQVEKTVNFLRKCEEYIFKVFALTGKQSNTGDSHFYKLAKVLFDHDIGLNALISDVEMMIGRHFRLRSFKETMDYYTDEEEGFYSWDYIHYFLFEYDLYLRENVKGALGKAINWSEYTKTKKDYVSVEHIYPKADKDCWEEIFSEFDDVERSALRNSLGNLLPLSTQRNSSFQNNCFELKKDDGKGGGYCVGSYSEAEVYKYDTWDAEKIKARGIKLLGFMEKRWNLEIEDKTRLLNLIFLDE